MSETILTNARIVLPDAVVAGSLRIADGRIAAIDPGRTAVPGAVDCAGDTVIPGLVELHTDHLEAHYAPRPKVRWDPLAAVQAHDVQVAGSGITTVLDALRLGMDEDERMLARDARTLADAIARAGEDDRLRADHFVHLRCEVAAADLEAAWDFFAPDGRVRLVSLMDHTPGQRQFTSLEAYKVYYQGKTGMDDAAFAAFVAARRESGALNAARNRPAIAERARAAGYVLASHDDATPEHVAEAVATGATVAEFPTTEAAAEAARAAGLAVLMGAPNFVRGGSHSGNVATEHVAAAGLLDMLSSDYVPSSLLQTAFALPHAVPAIGLPEAIALVTRAPARAVGLCDRGAIAEGLRGDVVRVATGGGLPAVRAVWREGVRVL